MYKQQSKHSDTLGSILYTIRLDTYDLLTLKSQYPSLPKWHGQVQGDVVLMVAHDTQELKLELKQRLHSETQKTNQ